MVLYVALLGVRPLITPDEPRYAAMGDVKQCFEDDSQGKPAWCRAIADHIAGMTDRYCLQAHERIFSASTRS